MAHRRGKEQGRELRRPGRLVRLLLALGCGLAPAAQADEGGASPEELKGLSLEQLMDVRVVSVARRPTPLARTPAAIEVITAEDIRRSGARSLPEALRLAGNLDVAQKNAHDWAISARGFNTALANKLLVMIDGRTVYTPLFSGVFWDDQSVLLADIDRIEVISGPGGTLWGANAVNGVINILTKDSAQTQGGYVELGGGTQPRGFAGARYGWSAGPALNARVYAQASDHDAERTVGGAPAHDAWRRGQTGFRLDAGAGDSDRLTVQGDLYRGREDILSGGSVRSWGGNLLGRWSRTLSARSDMSLQLYYDRTHLDDPVPALVVNGSLLLAPAGVLVDDLATVDADFQLRTRLGERHELVWGLGYRHTRDAVSNAPALAFYPERLDQDLYSAFLQDQIALREDLSLLVGSKLEHNDYTGFELEPSARLQWSPREDALLWAAVSRAVRTPSRIDRDLSEPARSQPLVLLRGDADFRSESVIAYELGYRREFGAVALSANLFYNRYDDVRSTSTTPGTILPFFFENNLQGHTYGLELKADWRPLENWRLGLGYAPLRERLRVKAGASDFNAAHNETADPRARWSLRSALDLPGRTELDLALRRVGRREINNGPTLAPVPAYTELDLRLAWHWREDVELALVGDNLLHARHVEYGFPGPEQVAIQRSVHGTLAWHF